MNGESSHFAMLLFNSACLQTQEDNSVGLDIAQDLRWGSQESHFKVNYNLTLNKTKQTSQTKTKQKSKNPLGYTFPALGDFCRPNSLS